MGKGGSQPSAPDPYASAAAQYQYGTQAAAYNAALNRVNTSGPTGSTTFDITGNDPGTGAPIYSENTTLTAPQQQILNEQQTNQIQQGQAAGGVLDQVKSQSGTPLQLQTQLNGNPQADYQRGFDTALKGNLAAITPQLSQQQEQLDASLRNAGSHPGDPAYDNAMAAFRAQETSSLDQAAGSAENTGLNLESEMFGQGLQGAEFGNSAQIQQLETPINEYQALTGGTQVQTPQAPAAASSTTNAPDIMQAFNNQYQGQLNQYNADVSSSNATTSDLSMLAAAALMFM